MQDAMQLGVINTLEILRETSVGLYLGDKAGFDVLLPNKFVPKNYEVGDFIDVFILKDSDERWLATTEKPKIYLHQFAYLEVVTNSKVGSFVDWGLDKDLFVPFSEQKDKLEVGRKYIVFLYVDEETERLVGSTKYYKFLEDYKGGFSENEEVDALFFERSDLGMNAIVNNKYKGLVYHDEIFRKITVGYRTKAYIKKLREDGNIDLTLKKMGYAHVEPNAEKILSLLGKKGGFLALTDKSKPEDIYDLLGMSKKTFKKAIGSLYKQRIIQLEKEGIKLV